MAREFRDDALLTWEVYASAGRVAEPEHARLVFHCLSEPSARARIVRIAGGIAEAERRLRRSSDAELAMLLAEAAPLE
ncbi:MAG: hypothetical protein ACODAE_05430 [Gemmatimonadota bacterium]